ncbi:MAG: metallophosphoesterase [Armatimonadota bacterium]
MNVRKFVGIALFAMLVCMVLSVGVQAINLTIFQTSDTHYEGTSPTNGTKATVQAMNGLAGMAWPYGGTIPTPSAVIVCGDLCDGGKSSTTPATDTPQWYSNRNYQHEWTGFDYNFPKNGVAGDNNRLKYPNYCVPGNHDYWRWCGYTLGTSTYVAEKLKARYTTNAIEQGNVYYSFNLGGVHFCAIGRYPSPAVLDWLTYDLSTVGYDAPVVLFLHYDFSDSDWWTANQRQYLANVLNAGYNVIAILNGHTHASQHYMWNGIDIYDDGSASANCGVNVIRITDTTVQVCHYTATQSNGTWTGGSWPWAHSKTW